MFPGPTELRLIGYSIEYIWTPKIQLKYIDTKNQHADILTKGKFTLDEWNHLLCLFNISHFSSTVCSEAMAKILQQDSGEERVTAKSRPTVSLIARTPSNLSSSTSESPVKRSCGNQDPWSAKAEREDRTEQPVVGSDPRTVPDYYHERSTESSFSARHSKWDDNKAWSSQEWKADPPMGDRTGQPVVASWGKAHESQSSFFHEKTAQSIVNEAKPRDRTGQPVVIPQRGARPQQFIIGNDETETELSVESRSFLNRVNDQVRKRQKRSSMNVTEKRRKTFYDMGNVHVCNIGISSIHGKELPGQSSFHHKYERSHIETNVRHIYKIGV